MKDFTIIAHRGGKDRYPNMKQWYTNDGTLYSLPTSLRDRGEHARRFGALVRQLEGIATSLEQSSAHPRTPAYRSNKARIGGIVGAFSIIWLGLALSRFPFDGHDSQPFSVSTAHLIGVTKALQSERMAEAGRPALLVQTSKTALNRKRLLSASTVLAQVHTEIGKCSMRPMTMSPTRTSDFAPTSSAVAHIGAASNIDYWVIPQGPFFQSPARVVPLGKSDNGIYVRNLDDGHNYRLTPSGEWYLLLPPSSK